MQPSPPLSDRTEYPLKSLLKTPKSGSHSPSRSPSPSLVNPTPHAINLTTVLKTHEHSHHDKLRHIKVSPKEKPVILEQFQEKYPHLKEKEKSPREGNPHQKNKVPSPRTATIPETTEKEEISEAKNLKGMPKIKGESEEVVKRKRSKSVPSLGMPPKIAPAVALYPETVRTHSSHELAEHVLTPRVALNRFSQPRRAKTAWVSISPKRSFDSQQDSCTEITHKSAVKDFNKSVLDYLTMAWAHAPKENILIKIQHAITVVCNEEISKMMYSCGIFHLKALYDEATNRSPLLLHAIQKSEALLQGISSRLTFFQAAISRWQSEGHVKTEWSDSLRLRIKELSITEEEESDSDSSNEYSRTSAKIDLFFRKLDILRHEVSAKEGAFIENAFGDNRHEIENVISLLKLWGMPSRETYVALDNHIKSACAENILNLSTPFKEHKFKLKEDYIEMLKHISLYEVHRCIKPDKYVLYNKITFRIARKGLKEEIFYEDPKSKIAHAPKSDEDAVKKEPFDGISPNESKSSEENEVRDLEFWESLLTKIYTQFAPEGMPEKSIRKQAKYICDHQAQTDNGVDIEEKLPCHLILKLLTNSSWGIGHACFKRFFESFFEVPYWAKVIQGMECTLTIRSSQKFEIAQTKTFVVYPRLNPQNANSQLINDKRPIARIPLTSTIGFYKGKWFASIAVQREGFEICKGATAEEKWFVYDTLKNQTVIRMLLSESSS